MILFTDCQRRVATGYRAYLLLAACWLFVFCPFSGLPRHQLLKAQTTPAPSQQAPPEGWIPALSEEFPRWLSSEEATNVAEKLAQSQVSLNYENDSTCPLNITYATTGSVEIARDTGKTPLYFIGLTCRVANNTNREIKTSALLSLGQGLLSRKFLCACFDRLSRMVPGSSRFLPHQKTFGISP